MVFEATIGVIIPQRDALTMRAAHHLEPKANGGSCKDEPTSDIKQF